MTALKKDQQLEHERSTGRCQKAATLSVSPLGEVSVCTMGCLHIDTPAVSVRLTEQEFLMLLGMLSAANRKLTSMQDAAVH